MTLKLVSWDEFRCVLHHFLSWTRLEGPWGPIWPETDRKPYRFKDLAVLKAKIKIENFSIRAGIGPKPKISLGKWQSGPSPGTPRGRGWPIQKLKNILSTSRKRATTHLVNPRGQRIHSPLRGSLRTPRGSDWSGRTYGRILYLSLGDRTENGHETAIYLVSGADFRGVLHHLLSLTRLKGSWGQVWAENGPKPIKLKSRF
jgi:hypothetical protein